MNRSSTHRRLTACLAALLLVAGVAHARHNGDYLNQVTTKFETPHITWAKPYSGGPLKVLFVVPRTFAPREIVELWQRFDLDFQAVTIAHSGLLSFESDAGAAPYDLAVEGTSIEEKTEEILSKLDRPCDAFVFANASFDVLPMEAQYKILRRVADGAGLLFTFGRNTRLPLFSKPTTDGRDAIFSGVPLAGLDYFGEADVLKAFNVPKPADLPPKLVETFSFKQGRVAVINWGRGSGTYYGGQGLTPPERYSLDWPADYEYGLSLVFKALLWTVPSREPSVQLTGLPEDGSHLDRAALPKGLALGVRCAKAGGLKGTLAVTIRDKTNAEELKQDLPLALQQGDNTVTVPVPALKAGGHFLDLIVRSAAGAEQWGSVFFTVDSPLTLSAFGAEREFYERSEPARVKASLSAPAPAGTKLRVSLTDTDGRRYEAHEVAVPAGKTEAQLDCRFDHACTIASRLHGDLVVGDAVVDAKDQLLFVPRRSSDEFRSVIWGVGGDTGLTWLAVRQLRDAGFNGMLNHPSADGDTERLFALGDFPLVCYSYRIMGDTDAKGWRKDAWVRDVDDACFYNPELQQKARDVVLGRIKPVIPYGPSLYTLGDENYFGYESGYSPIGLRAFRDYCRKQYPSLDALNREWGTTYADWDQVELLLQAEALKRGLWPMIHEHMGFNETEYADYHHFLTQAIKGADRFAKVGAEGSVPGDLEKTIAGLDIWGPYEDKRGNELLRSLASHDLVRGNWWGGYVGSHGARAGAAIVWDQLLNGFVNTSLFFAATGSEGLFATDLSYAGFFEKMLPELREIYGGTGQVISASEVPDDGIAIHWSQANEHAATLFSSLGSPNASQGNLLGLLDRSGFGCRYVTTSGIESGALRRSGYRVLFLACSEAISDAEAQAIRDFVAAGGTVVADVAPGLLDGHCRRLWPTAGDAAPWRGQLDDLLGLSRTGEPKSKQVTGSLSVPFGGRPLALSDFPFRMDTTFTATHALGNVAGTPVFVTGQAGKGAIILLNFTFPSPEHPQAQAFMGSLLAGLGLQPFCELPGGKGYSFRRLRNGDLNLVGVIRQAETAGDATLQLSQPAFVYDVRAGKPLGKQTSLPIGKAGPRVRLFAVLSAPTEGLAIAAPNRVVRGGVLTAQLTLKTGGVKPAGRVLRVQLFRPDKREAMPYRSFVTLATAEGRVSVPFALNDPTGLWTLTATDVATGASASSALKLE